MDALAFLEKSAKAKRQPVYVLSGEEDFLKRRVLAAIQALAVGDADPAFAVTTFTADKADFSTVRNELDTLPFLSDRRLVVVEQADPFVTKNRPALEKYVAAPSQTGVLVLEVKSFPATTKLAKALPEAAHVVCNGPAAYRVPAWCVKWAESQYGKKLPQAAAELLVELVGPQMGMLDQELNKLAVYAGEAPSITSKDVDQLVGRSRAANVFRIMDAVGEGKPAEALTILGELFEEGEEPIAILGQLGSQVRRIARAARLIKQKVEVEQALDRAGVPKWPQARDGVKRAMRHLGWSRLERLYEWLIELDLGMKGGSQLPPRLLLERLVVRLARPRAG